MWNTEVVIHVQVNCTILPKIYVTKNAILYSCISVSAKGFYKSQHVLDFLQETLQLSPRQLEDSRFQIDKRGLEKAIRGNNQSLVY